MLMCELMNYKYLKPQKSLEQDYKACFVFKVGNGKELFRSLLTWMWYFWWMEVTQNNEVMAGCLEQLNS